MDDIKERIEHSGILGMKWGIRRYQNPDGSLTLLGRLHYGVGPEKKKVVGVNDIGALSDDELYKMTKRLQKQADYYQAKNNYINQENYYKQLTTPKVIKKEHTFFDNVIKRPIENFLGKNVEFGMNYSMYSLIGQTNPELASQYMSSVMGIRVDKKDPEKEKEKKAESEANYQKNRNIASRNEHEYSKRQREDYSEFMNLLTKDNPTPEELRKAKGMMEAYRKRYGDVDPDYY